MKFPEFTTTQTNFVNFFRKTGTSLKQQEKEKKRKPHLQRLDTELEKCRKEWKTLERLPGTTNLLEVFQRKITEINRKIDLESQKTVGTQQFEVIKEVSKELEGTKKQLRETLKKVRKSPLVKDKLEAQGRVFGDLRLVPPELGKTQKMDINRGGPLIRSVFNALHKVESAPPEELDQAMEKLDQAAATYLEKKGDQGDDEREKKTTFCKDLRRRVEIYQRFAQRVKEQQPPPWNEREQTQARQLQAEILLAHAPVKTTDQPGASESFVLESMVPGTKALVFKPMDGENIAGYGWEKGGGAPREVMVSALNEHFKETIGLDFRVGRTSLVKLDDNSLASVKNGNQTERVGSVQDFVVSTYDYSKELMNKLPSDEVHGVFLLDFVTLQLDRNDGNFLFPRDEEGVHVAPIDAGNALPSPKAFEAFRRNFTSGALFSTEAADKKFSKEVLQSIDRMDPEKTVAALRSANNIMGDVDPEAAGHLKEENLEMVARSIKFLKAAAPRFTPRQLGDGYAFVFHKVLAAGKENVEVAIQQAMEEMEQRAKLFEELNKLDYSQALLDLGWPTGQNSFMGDDPAFLLAVVKNKREYPPAVQEYELLVKKIETNLTVWGEMAGKMYENNITGAKNKPLADRLKLARAIVKQFKKAQERQYNEDGGDDLLSKLGLLKEEMSESAKRRALYEHLYKAEIGKYEQKVNEIEAAGFNVRIKIVPKSGLPNYPDLFDAIRAYDEYVELGGEERYVKLNGQQGFKMTEPVTKLEALKTLIALDEWQKSEKEKK